MHAFDAARSARLLAIGLAFALVGGAAAKSPARKPAGDRSAGACVIVEYKTKGDKTYTWYYCPSSRVFIQSDQRWITDFDTGIETRVSDKDRKVQTLPLTVKQDMRRPELARRSAFSIKATGKTEVIAGVRAREYLFSVTYDGQPMDVHQWFATDLPVPGRDKAVASDIDVEMAHQVPPGVFLRSDDREATSVTKGKPPATMLAIPADYQKLHWSAEKNGWVADGE